MPQSVSKLLVASAVEPHRLATHGAGTPVRFPVPKRGRIVTLAVHNRISILYVYRARCLLGSAGAGSASQSRWIGALWCGWGSVTTE